MGSGPQLPVWVRPGLAEVRDVMYLAVDLMGRQSREAAGIAAVIQWLLGVSAGPVTGRADDADLRNVAVVELCAAEQKVDDGPVPPLRDACRHYNVVYQPPLPVDVGFARGVWLELRWALGEASLPPLQIPIRHPDGRLMTMTEIYTELVARGKDQTAAREQARRLCESSLRLAALVEDVASRRG